MGQRKPLYNAELQTDLDGKGFNIRNVNQLDVVQTGTVYVDPGLATEVGKIDSFMAFKTLQSAISAAPAGYTIILRPGAHVYDGILQIHRAHVKLFGPGAIISPATAGQTAGLLITSNYVELNGLEFDGGTNSPSNTGTVIEIDGATNVRLNNLIISDQHGDGITLTDGYDLVSIESCNISGCYRAIAGGITSHNDITGINIVGNLLQDCRLGGVLIHGNDNDDRVRDIKIIDNDISNCNTSGGHAAGIDVSAGCQDVVISNNYITRSFYGIYCTLSQRVSIASNSITGTDDALIYNDGNKYVTIDGNLLDGSSPATGNPHAPSGITMVGFFTASGNDAGPYTITNNLINGIVGAGTFVLTSNANDILIQGNQFNSAAVISAMAFNTLKISDNNFNIPSGSTAVIQLDASTRGWQNCTIADNRFKLAVTVGWSRLIKTNDSLATGQNNLTVVGNWSTTGITYSQGLYNNAAGANPTNAFFHSNSPQASEWDRSGGAPNPKKGWVNDYQLNMVSERINIPTDSATKYQVGGSQVVGSRITGWSLPTTTATRTTFDASTVTLPELAKRVATLIRDLHITTGHGLIGFYS